MARVDVVAVREINAQGKGSLAVEPKKQNAFRSLLSGGSGPLEVIGLFAEGINWGNESLGVLSDRVVEGLDTLSGAVFRAAPICCLPEALVEMSNGWENLTTLVNDPTGKNLYNLSHTMVNIAYKVTKFVGGMIALGLMGDPAMRGACQIGRNVLRLIHRGYVFYDLTDMQSEQEWVNIDPKLRKWQEDWKIIANVSGVGMHVISILSVVLSGVITGKIVLFASLTTLTLGIISLVVEQMVAQAKGEWCANEIKNYLTIE